MTKVTTASISKAIGQFTTNRDKLRDSAHTIAMMIFYHAAPKEVSSDCNGTGDCTLLPKFIGELPRGWADNMKLWFHEFTPIRVSADNKNTGYDPKYKKLSPEDKLKWWKLDEANVKTFEDMTADRGNGATKVLTFDDLVKMTQGMAKRIEKILEGEDSNRVIKEEDRLSAQAFALAINNIKIERIVAAPADNDAATGDEKVAA